VDEDAERELEEEGLNVTRRGGSRQKLNRNRRTKEREEKQADENERRRKRQTKGIYNFLSAVKYREQLGQTLTVQLTAPYLKCTVHAH
jgi:hypothetical protein